jgi:SM-20-related protein
MPNPNEPRVDAFSEDLLDEICVALANQGYCILDAAFPSELVQSLQLEARSLSSESYRLAGTGRQTELRIDPGIRSDRIAWVEQPGPAARCYLLLAEQLRIAINNRLFLGLFDYECHFACYEAGAFYGKHRDAFVGSRNRMVSTVLYLNEDWQQSDGGALVLYQEEGQAELARVSPVLNTFVLFLSEFFPHEVLPAQRPRYSLTGWFRLREG